MLMVTWVAVAQKVKWVINYRLKFLDKIYYNSGWVSRGGITNLSLTQSRHTFNQK